MTEYDIVSNKSTQNINGIEVPFPELEELNKYSPYYIPYLIDSVLECTWTGNTDDLKRLNNGLIHLNPHSALIHSKALSSFFKKKIT